MQEKVFKFIYMDRKGNISARKIYSISKQNGYIQGICFLSNALRTFREERILEYLQESDDEREFIEKCENQREFYLKKLNISLGNKRKSHLEICFTGFQNVLKNELIELAEKNGFTVVKSVTKNLVFLCCGNNAGPSKIEKSRKQGVIAISETQFKLILETGELPEETVL